METLVLGTWSKCGRYLGALLGLVALPACSEPACDVCTTSAIIYGRVLDANAGLWVAPKSVSKPIVRLAALRISQRHRSQGYRQGADGNYRARLRTPFGPFTACPRVTVESASGLPGPVTVEGPVVEFLDDLGSNPLDSVRVDVAFPAAAH